MTHGSLFSGIGGFDLAAEWVGWENKFHCEWNEFGQKVLKYYWPNAESFTDITKTNFSKYEKKIDVLTGGFPCQPYSMAGKRKGKDDERHLWPEMCRAIREIKPRWIVGENVLGLVNWDDGLVFHEVQTDLENEGYEVQPFLLPAAAVNAPHRRDRIWFIAHARDSRDNRGSYKISTQTNKTNKRKEKQSTTPREQIQLSNQSNFIFKNVTYAESVRLQSEMAFTKLERKKRFEFSPKWNEWYEIGIESPLCTRNDGVSFKLDGITFSKWREESVKAAGNAIVPQVALQIFKAIQEYENLNLGTGVTEQKKYGY